MRNFEAAIVANLAYQRQEGEAEMAAPVAYLSLLSMAVPPDSEQAKTLAARHGVDRLPAATRVLVLAASHLDPARLRVRVETNEHEAVFENVDVDGNEHGYAEGMILYPSSARAPHGERLLVYARGDVSTNDPLVAALYVVRARRRKSPRRAPSDGVHTKQNHRADPLVNDRRGDSWVTRIRTRNRTPVGMAQGSRDGSPPLSPT